MVRFSRKRFCAGLKLREPRIAPQRVEAPFGLQSRQAARTLLDSAVQPLEGLLMIAQVGAHEGDVVRRNMHTQPHQGPQNRNKLGFWIPFVQLDLLNAGQLVLHALWNLGIF